MAAVLLSLALGGYLVERDSMPESDGADKVAAKPLVPPGAEVSSEADSPVDVSQGGTGSDPSKPVRIRAQGKVRLKAGETAVLSYWEIEPGMNGLLLVTPETLPDGNIAMKTHVLQASDRALEQAAAQDMLPDIFGMDQYGAVGAERLNEFLRAVLTDGEVNVVSYPRMVTKPGMALTVRTGVTEPDSEWSGLMFDLQAQPLDDGGHELSMDLAKRGSAP